MCGVAQCHPEPGAQLSSSRVRGRPCPHREDRGSQALGGGGIENVPLPIESTVLHQNPRDTLARKENPDPRVGSGQHLCPKGFRLSFWSPKLFKVGPRTGL